MSDVFDKLLILRTPGIGPVKYAELIRRFGDVHTAAASLRADSHLVDSVRAEMERAAANDIIYIPDDSDLYPNALRQVKNHPPVITARGNVVALRRPVVSMVGTRHATAAGMQFMADLACAFATHGFAVASGLAAGTDAAAHRGALVAAGDANTIAVVAGGVDYIWPVENESLYHEIVARGVIISEMPVGYVPVATNFIQRNRWVAALCDTLVLGEADLKSGSMTTARFAQEFNRDLYAIPSHPSDSRAMGPNSLIAGGVAKLCSGVSDFFADCAPKQKQTKKSDEPDSVLDKLGIIPVSESVLADICQKNISEIKRDLVLLEMQGLIRKTDGGYVRI